MRKGKKAQAAMEFLMTYGWAILVVLVAIGALAYFGVLNPARFLPASCTLMPGLSCTNFKVTAPQVELIVQNGMGQDLTSFSIGTTDATVCTTAGSPTGGNLIDGAEATITITGCSNTLGSRFKEDLTMTYTDAGGLSHTRTGQIISEVEA